MYFHSVNLKLHTLTSIHSTQKGIQTKNLIDTSYENNNKNKNKNKN